MVYLGSIVPHVRVGRERWTQRARKYRASQDSIAWELKQSAALVRIPEGGLTGPWRVELAFHRNGQGDLDNLIKSVLDAGNGILWQDDRYVTTIVASLHKCKKGEDAFHLEVECPYMAP